MNMAEELQYFLVGFETVPRQILDKGLHNATLTANFEEHQHNTIELVFIHRVVVFAYDMVDVLG